MILFDSGVTLEDILMSLRPFDRLQYSNCGCSSESGRYVGFSFALEDFNKAIGTMPFRKNKWAFSQTNENSS